MRMLTPISAEFAWPRLSVSPTYVGDIFEQFDGIIDGILKAPAAGAPTFQAACDVRETKDYFVVSFDVPGVKREDLKVELKGNELLISGHRQRQVTPKEGEMTIRQERSYGSFERRFTLPNTIAAEKIEAHHEDGVLTIALPKVEPRAERNIEVRSGQNGFLSQFLGTKKADKSDLKEVKIS